MGFHRAGVSLSVPPVDAPSYSKQEMLQPFTNQTLLYWLFQLLTISTMLFFQMDALADMGTESCGDIAGK